MSKYIRCFLLMFVYLFGFEFAALTALSAAFSDVPGLIRFASLPLPSLFIWGFLQFVIAYLLCVLLSRTDSTSVGHNMIFSSMLGLIIGVVQYASFAVNADYWHVYLILMPITLLKFTLAGGLFAKLQ